MPASPSRRLATVYVFPPPLPESAPFRLVPPDPPVPRKPKRKRKPPVSLSDEQLLALLATAEAHRHRDAIMIAVTYWHGLRASEAVNLREADIENGQIRVQRGKGSDATLQDLQEHENPLLNERALIADWLLNRERYGAKGGAKKSAPKMLSPARRLRVTGESEADLTPARSNSGRQPDAVPEPHGQTANEPDCELQKMRQSKEIVAFSPVEGERLFPISRVQFYRLIHKYALAAGIPKRKCKTHMLKHTIAKHLVRAGHPLNEIQEWMGWASLETMNWYTRADEEELGNRIGDRIRAKQGLRPVRQGSLFS